MDYEDGMFSITWKGVPKAAPTVSYRSKAGSVVLTDEKELAMQVIVEGDDGPELRPGTPSYIDITNGADDALEGGYEGGGDCQVYELSIMEELTTKWLRAQHAPVIDRLEKRLAPFGYETGTENLFQAMTTTFYDSEHFSRVSPKEADLIVEAGMEVFRTIRKSSVALEKFILANGVKKVDKWAPRASGL
jgi:hypothetical protein